MRFAANITTMFTNLNVNDRIIKAKHLGFNVIEAQDIYRVDLESFKNTLIEQNVQLYNINSPTTPGFPYDPVLWKTVPEDPAIKYVTNKAGFIDDNNVDLSRYESPILGFACLKHNLERFVVSTGSAILLCNCFKIPRLHILAGNMPSDQTFEECETCYLNSLNHVLSRLEEYDVVGLIEPLSNKEKYFLQSFEKAIEYLQIFNNDNLKLLLDVYHLYNIEGSIDGLAKYLPYAGHVQISQAPNRDDPFSEGGAIDYEEVFRVLRENNYTGPIGLEYSPQNVENPDLGFMARFA